MKNFSLHLPTRIEFGQDILSTVGKEAAEVGKRALLLYGKDSIKRNGVYNSVIKSLKNYNIEWIEHFGVSPNPKLAHAFEGALAAKQFESDVIIAVGGGSVIDEAKAIALGYFASSKDDLWSFFLRKKEPEKALPIIAVMTMPASSSEMNSASVITHEETKEKFSVRSSLLAPTVSLLDPTVTTSISLQQTAFACTDIISHLSEGFFTNTDEFAPVQQEFSLGLMKAVKSSMDILMENPHNLQARSALMWAGSLGWNGLGVAGWEGAKIPCHTLEHPISGLYDLPHGAGLSIVTLAYLKMRKNEISEKIATFGNRIFDLDIACSPDEVIEKLQEWYQQIGTPTSFKEWNPDMSIDVSLLVNEAIKLDKIWNLSNFSEDEFTEAYKLMM